MRISTKLEYVWSTKQDRYILLRDQSIYWTGQVAVCKGASSAQENLANQQANFYNTLTNDYNTQFSNQSAILKQLNNSLSPIINAGPNQFGFSTGETNNLNSQAIQGTAGQYANAARALRENQAAQGGGNIALPSGANAQQQAALAAAGANSESNALLGIQQAGYEQGRQNYFNALGQEQGVAGMYNPTSYGQIGNTAGNNAFGSATTVQQMNNAASPWNVVGGILGGAIGAGLNGFTGGFGGALGKSLGSGGGSGGGSYDSGD